MKRSQQKNLLLSFLNKVCRYCYYYFFLTKSIKMHWKRENKFLYIKYLRRARRRGTRGFNRRRSGGVFLEDHGEKVVDVIEHGAGVVHEPGRHHSVGKQLLRQCHGQGRVGDLDSSYISGELIIKTSFVDIEEKIRILESGISRFSGYQTIS